MAGSRLCVVSFKPCWRDPQGRWMSDGGFPMQMTAVSSLFDDTTMVIVEVPGKPGGIPLPPVRIVPLRSPAGADTRRKFSVLSSLPYYLRTIRREVRAADVVHVPVPGDISLLGLVLALVSRKRLIARYGSSWALTPQTTPAQRVTRWFMQTFAGGRNVMLATGIGRTPPAPRMTWIFSTALSARELRDIHPVFDRALSQPARLVYVGRLSTEKGVRFLLRALVRVNARMGSAAPRLALLGDGPERASLERLVDELGLRNQVTFAGYLDRTRLSAALGEADLCVQPSLTEGFSKAWLDALAHGVPVVSSRVGAAASVLGEAGECGWLVPPGEEEALAATLVDVLTGPTDWPTMRRRCRTTAEGWTLEAWARQIGEICARQWGAVFEEGKLRA